MSNITQKSPGIKKEFDDEITQEIKTLPLDKDLFDRLLDKIENQHYFLNNVINEA